MNPAKPGERVANLRACFPALQRVCRRQPVAYFDGPGGTQVPLAVVDAIRDYLLEHNANTHWEFRTSAETDAIIHDSRVALADFLNGAPDEIAFGANMTTLTFHLSRALGRSYSSGDEILLTELEHHANVAPWRTLEKDRGVVVRQARMIPETGELDWDHFASQLNNRTKLVAIGAASNALGTVTDVRRASDLAHSAGAQIFVDAVHYAPHELVDVRQFDCDFLSCSAYKFYGPHIGVLWGRHQLLAALDFPKLAPAPDTAPERAETGTQNHEGIAGAAAAVNFLASLGTGGSRRERLTAGFGFLGRRGDALVRRLWQGLTEIERVQLYGPAPGAARTPTVSFNVRGLSSLEVARELTTHDIFVSHGDFYATSLVERLCKWKQGQDQPEWQHGLVRAGCACYTTEEEVDRLIDSLRAILSKSR